jgi:hypothetical protein
VQNKPTMQQLRAQVVNFDPPVLTVDGFLDAETCAALIESARDSGALTASGVGDGSVGSAGGGVDAARRTSRTLLVGGAVQRSHPRLRARPSRGMCTSAAFFCTVSLMVLRSVRATAHEPHVAL